MMIEDCPTQEVNMIIKEISFSAMIRRDASTRFGPGNKVGYFPSFTAGWVVSDEGFLAQIK
jgi:hypothetical protein